MKGDGFIKIKINIRGIYKYNDKQPYVFIYDMNNNLVSSGYARCGVYYACLNECKRYKVIVKFLNSKVCSYIYTNRCEFDIYLNICIKQGNNRTVTFRLVDYFYNLPIAKGVLNFGQTSNYN